MSRRTGILILLGLAAIVAATSLYVADKGHLGRFGIGPPPQN